MPQVTVLLATYNGSKYVRQMIDSVLAQSYGDFHLVLSDDSSKDDTPQILEEYAQKYPHKITHYRSGLRFGNAQNHFMHLLAQFHDTPYIMFCDQDDIWHPDKMEKAFQKMKHTEQNSATPTLVHPDLRVVDSSLQELSPSFCQMSDLDGNRLTLPHLLVQNVVTGCTVMVNRALAVLACKNIPSQGILMHDWWLALIASALGTIGFLDETTIDYRQHGNNSVGAKNVRSLQYIKDKLVNQTMHKSMLSTYAQAQLFLQCYGDVLPQDKHNIVAKLAKNCTNGYLKRVVTLLSGGYCKKGFARNLAQILWG